MFRRALIANALGILTLAHAQRAAAQFQPSQRYPDPLVRVIDASFAKYRLNLANPFGLAMAAISSGATFPTIAS
jgi:gluconolactonase